MRDALDTLVDEGVASIANSPYSDVTCSAPSNASAFFLDGYHRIETTDAAAIKTALTNFNVLPIGMKVYADFESISNSSVYVHPASDASCALGGHCISVVGFDDARGAYRVMNSWSTRWGDRGFAWMAYDTFPRVVQEVYVPYTQSSGLSNTLVRSATSSSGSISAVSAYSRCLFNEATGQFDTALMFFKLNDAVGVSSYRLRAVSTTSVSTVLVTQPLGQILRGLVVQAPITTAIAANTRYFVLDLSGISRRNETISLSIFSQFPDPNGR